LILANAHQNESNTLSVHDISDKFPTSFQKIVHVRVYLTLTFTYCRY